MRVWQTDRKLQKIEPAVTIRNAYKVNRRQVEAIWNTNVWLAIHKATYGYTYHEHGYLASTIAINEKVSWHYN
jgi:hypothetical protein